jgi:hypothetical protein
LKDRIWKWFEKFQFYCEGDKICAIFHFFGKGNQNLKNEVLENSWEDLRRGWSRCSLERIMTHPFHHFDTPDAVVTYFNEQQSANFPFPKAKATSAETLSGGNANRVYRINLQHDPTNNVAPTSVVFKYYAPFMAVDPTFALSQDRYFVEKEALTFASTLFSSSDPKKAPLRVPRLYVTDDTNKVLLMEDAGSHLKS